MSYDPEVPPRLREIQDWFGGIVASPLSETGGARAQTPSGASLVEEAQHYLTPGPTLKPHQRIEIYNQQYWWRLIDAYQENFPTLLRLFGYDDFNTSLIIPCLTEERPNHWSLGLLGQQLVNWIEHNYRDQDRQLVLDVARIDRASSLCFVAGEHPRLSAKNLTEDFSQNTEALKLRLQPSIHLFKLKGNLFQFREELLKEAPEHWEAHDFPPMAKGTYFILFRGPNKQSCWKELTEAQFCFLNSFSAGCSLAEACDELEVHGEIVCQEALRNLHLWMRQWTASGWFTLAQERLHTLPV